MSLAIAINNCRPIFYKFAKNIRLKEHINIHNTLGKYQSVNALFGGGPKQGKKAFI